MSVLPPKWTPNSNMGGTYCFNNKIKFKLEVKNDAVELTILEMDERFRTTGHTDNLFKASNGLFIASSSQPYISIDYIYLRGLNRAWDGLTVGLMFASNQIANCFAKKAEEAIKDWAYNWEGWNNRSVKATNEQEALDAFNGWAEAARHSFDDSNISLSETDGIEDLKQIIKEKDKKIQDLEYDVAVLKKYLDAYREEIEALKGYIEDKPNKLDIY